MPEISFSLPLYYSERFFGTAIRSKLDTLNFLFDTIGMINVYQEVNKPDNGHKVCIVSEGRMNRLFFCSPEKIYSVNFHFSIRQGCDGRYYVHSKYGVIDEKIVAVFKRLFNILATGSDGDIYSLIDGFEEALKDFDIIADDFPYWSLFIELLKMEDGYLRYDYDKKRENGRIHPLNHIDLFYTSGSQIKVGLYGRVIYEELATILDKKTDCYYLHQYSIGGTIGGILKDVRSKNRIKSV